MRFLSDILAKAGLIVDGAVVFNSTANGQTPASNDDSTKLATTAWVRSFTQPYTLPIASATILGGVKVGTGLAIDPVSGVLSLSGGSITLKSTETFTATQGQSIFTITNGYTVGLIDVFLNGVYLSPGQITATNGTTIILNDPAIVGDIIDVIITTPLGEGSVATTDQISEGTTNLYYTDARARAAISLTTTGVSGAATYNTLTGQLNIPNYQGLVPAGGIAGQILAKNSATSYDTTWIDNYTSQVQHIVKAGVAVTKGQAVYVSSADGTNMIVSKASNASEGTSSKTLGLVAQDLAINGQGFVITEGLLAGLDTSTANAGDPVWLGTNGNLIYGLLNKPTAPAHLVFIGVVTRVQQNNGEIFVKVQNGFEFGELHDYVQNGVQDKYVVSYESATSLYKPKSIATLLGYTPANAATTITINGTTYDLSANRSWDIAGGVTSFNTRTGAITLTSADVTGALGYTPYNATNPSGYVTASALSGYLPLTGGTLTSADATQLVLLNSSTNVRTSFGSGSMNTNLWSSGGFDVRTNYPTNSTSRLFIDIFGQVGINTNLPSYRLDVNGSGRFTQILYGTSASFSSSVTTTSETTDSSLIQQWGYSGNSSAYRLRLNTIVSSGLVKYSFDLTNNSTAYNNTLVLTNSNIGIGRPTPEFTLDVNGDIAFNRTNKLMFAGPVAGDRSRSYLTGDGNNNIFVYGPSSNLIATFAYTGYTSLNGLLDLQGSNTISSANDKFAIGVNGTSYGWIQSFGGRHLVLQGVGNNVGIGTTNPTTKFWVQQGVSTFACDTLGDTAINTFTSSSLLLGPRSARNAIVGSYMAGISFDHLLNYTATGSTFYSSVPHAWVGLRLIDTPGWERSALVFATRNDVVGTAGTTLERMCVMPNGNVGIATTNPLAPLHVNGDIRTTGLRLNQGTNNQGHRIYSRTMDVSAYTSQTSMRFTVAAGNSVQFQYEITFHATRLSGTLAEIWYLRYTGGIAYDTAGNPNERWWDLREQAGNGIAGVGRNNNTGNLEITNSAFDTSCRLTVCVKITCNNWDAVTVSFS